MVKNLPANAGDSGDSGNTGWIPELGRSLGEGNGNPLLSILAWRILRTEEPSGLQSMGDKELDTAEHTHTHNYLSIDCL